MAKYAEFERNPGAVSRKGLEVLLNLSRGTLAPEHWVAASLADLAQDYYSHVGEPELAAEQLLAWCACWRASVRLPSHHVAWKLERAGDICTGLTKFERAVELYLEALAELAYMPTTHPYAVDVRRKLGRALLGHQNDSAW